MQPFGIFWLELCFCFHELPFFFFFLNGFNSFEPKAYVHSKFITGLLKLFCIVFPLSESTNVDLSGLFWETGVACPQHLSGILFLTRLLCICRLLRAFPAAWLIHPSHFLFVLCLGDLFWMDITYLLVCWLLPKPVLRSPMGWGSLPADTGSFRVKNTWDFHKTYCGVFGKSTKSGEREALGKEPAWKTRGKGYRRGWLYVSKWLFSAHVYPG